ncbi:MAG TPA: hypothetical protein VHC22_17360 [Pirellulales bacterium]|nr:hypothetical protein [Pirellulales bacterium]
MRKSAIFVAVLCAAGWLVADEPDKPATDTTSANDKSTPADPPHEQPDLGETVRQLIRELDAGQKARREEAEKKLLALGVKALDHLPENTDRLSAEAGQRLDRVREKLEKSVAENSIEKTVVTLTGEQPLSEVLAAIEKQTGNKIVDLREEFGQEVGDPKLKVDFKETPFWPALDQVLDDAELTIYPYASEQGGLGITSRSGSRVPRRGTAIYSEAFRIEGTEFIARRDLRDPMSHMLSLTLEASWEPRLRPIVITQPSAAVTAVDDNGQAISVSASSGDMQIPVDSEMKSVEIPIQFELPERNARRIASLKGKLTAMLPGRVETFRFGNLDKTKRVDRKRAGVTVALEGVRKNGAVWEVRVLLMFEKATGALESHLSTGWVSNNYAALEGPDQKIIQHAGLETTRETETDVGVAYYFDVPSLKGHTLIYKTPTAIVSLPVEYELKDLDLP